VIDLIGNWIIANYIELLGAILGIAYVFFSIRQNILTWPIGLLTSILYVWVFLVSKLYADMALQIYYVVISIYGWHVWLYGNRNDSKKVLKISRLTIRMASILSLITALFFALIWILLTNYTDSTVPVADALATALSLVATWMLARKILEHWLIWIFVDIFSIGLFWYKELYPTVFLFAVYTIMAVVGFTEWKKEFASPKN
jgi:nicotinamide mononucleotide transporter